MLSAGFFALASGAIAKPQPGDLDGSFGGNGVVRTHVDGMNGGADSVAIDRSHRIVAVGTTNLGDPAASGFLLARYKPRGKLDPSFSGDGMRSVAFPDLDASDRAVALGKGGAVTVAGVTCPRQGRCQYSVARLTPDGELDRGFGEEGRATVHFGRPQGGISIAIDSRGRAVVAGTTRRAGHRDFALMRLKKDGELDPRFGNDGRVATNVDEGGFRSCTCLGDMAIDSRGRIIAAGDTSRGALLVRYQKDGDRSRSFGRDGIALKRHLEQLGGIGAIAITPRDKIVAAGSRKSNKGKQKWVLARFGRSGGLNRSFGDGGEVAIDIPGEGNSFVRDVAIDSRNRIVATGTPDISVARFQPNGNLNRSFSRGGTVKKELHALAESVAVDSRNRPVVAGNGGTRFLVARFIG